MNLNEFMQQILKRALSLLKTEGFHEARVLDPGTGHTIFVITEDDRIWRVEVREHTLDQDVPPGRPVYAR